MKPVLPSILGIALLMLGIVTAVEGRQNPIDIAGYHTSVKIIPEDQRQFRILLPNVEQNNAIILSWRARIDADRLRSGREFMRVEINGKTVGAMQDRLHARLLNKPLEFTDHIGRGHSWYTDAAGGWLTPFSPDFSPPGIKTWFYKQGENAYLYQIDVTDLIKYGAENLIVFENQIQHRYVQKYRKGLFEHANGDLVLKDIRLEFRKRASGTAAAPEAANTLATGRAQWDVQVQSSGEIALILNSTAVRIESAFAKGDGTWMRPFRKGGGGQLSGTSSTSWRFSAETPRYRIDRTVQRYPDRIVLKDRVASLGQPDIAVVIPKYQLFVPAQRFATAWIGGDPDPLLNDVHSPYNPTLYIPMDGVGLGMVVEDDVMRLQGKFSYDAGLGLMEIRSDELVVSSQGAGNYTIALTLYPTMHASYWDFINRVRQDWQVNTVMPGTIWFTYPEQILQLRSKDLGTFIKANNVAYVIFWESPSPRFHQLQAPYLIRGAAQLRKEAQAIRFSYEMNLKAAIGRLHDIDPEGIKALLYFHSHTMSLFDEDRLDELSDALITTKDGRPIRRHRNDPRYYPLYYVLPTEKNQYGRELERLTDHFFRLGADGIYWDEMPAGTRKTRTTYSQFDGYSADISLENQQVMQLKGLVGLLSSPYKTRLVMRLLQKGKTVHVNGAPETRSLQALPMTVMVETKTSGALTKRLHLATPYAYTWGPLDMQQFRERLAGGGLAFRPGNRTPFLARSFPMTPEYIGGGYIVGKERIVAAVSGTFGWEGPWKAALMMYDSSGRMIRKHNTDGAGGRKMDVPLDGLAILERIP